MRLSPWQIFSCTGLNCDEFLRLFLSPSDFCPKPPTSDQLIECGLNLFFCVSGWDEVESLSGKIFSDLPQQFRMSTSRQASSVIRIARNSAGVITFVISARWMNWALKRMIIGLDMCNEIGQGFRLDCFERWSELGWKGCGTSIFRFVSWGSRSQAFKLQALRSESWTLFFSFSTVSIFSDACRWVIPVKPISLNRANPCPNLARHLFHGLRNPQIHDFGNPREISLPNSFPGPLAVCPFPKSIPSNFFFALQWSQ